MACEQLQAFIMFSCLLHAFVAFSAAALIHLVGSTPPKIPAVQLFSLEGLTLLVQDLPGYFSSVLAFCIMHWLNAK